MKKMVKFFVILIPADSVISCTSSNNSVVDIDNEKIIAKRKGIAYVTVVFEDDIYCTKVTVLNGFAAPIRDGETLCLGKDPKFANIVFTGNYEKVSRMHCTITYDAAKKRYYVVDCSSNGTFLAGKVRMEKGKRTVVMPKTVITLANGNCTILLG